LRHLWLVLVSLVCIIILINCIELILLSSLCWSLLWCSYWCSSYRCVSWVNIRIWSWRIKDFCVLRWRKLWSWSSIYFIMILNYRIISSSIFNLTVLTWLLSEIIRILEATTILLELNDIMIHKLSYLLFLLRIIFLLLLWTMALVFNIMIV